MRDKVNEFYIVKHAFSFLIYHFKPESNFSSRHLQVISGMDEWSFGKDAVLDGLRLLHVHPGK